MHRPTGLFGQKRTSVWFQVYNWFFNFEPPEEQKKKKKIIKWNVHWKLISKRSAVVNNKKKKNNSKTSPQQRSQKEAWNNKFYCGETVKNIFIAKHGIEIRRNYVTWCFTIGAVNFASADQSQEDDYGSASSGRPWILCHRVSGIMRLRKD